LPVNDDVEGADDDAGALEGAEFDAGALGGAELAADVGVLAAGADGGVVAVPLVLLLQPAVTAVVATKNAMNADARSAGARRAADVGGVSGAARRSVCWRMFCLFSRCLPAKMDS
jgi:hypothetical protein